jgi:3-phytase
MNQKQINNSFLLFAILIAFSCKNNSAITEEIINPQDTIYQVVANIETDPVVSLYDEDAADDPAIWIHPENVEMSRIIGTNKKSGMAVYDLDGKQVFFYPVGNVNNVDVRYNFPLNDKKVDIVAASNRTHNSITLFIVEADSGSLVEASARMLKSEVIEVYGFCLYNDKETNKFYAFINGKEGKIEQWELFANEDDKIDGKIVRRLHVASQPEGMVADDEMNILYVGEEIRGIWKFDAKAEGDSIKTLIANSDSLNTNIVYDVEGLSIYYASEGQGYLIASSQGNFTYAVFERTGNNNYLGSFEVIDGDIDGSDETDGLDVINLNLGPKYPYGFFIAQDGMNYEKDSLMNQNFKVVAWEKIAKTFKPNLLIDNTYNPYR